MNEEEIEQVLKRRKRWILNTISRYSIRKEYSFATGSKIPFIGRDISIKIIHQGSALDICATDRDNENNIIYNKYNKEKYRHRNGLLEIYASKTESVKSTVESFYRNESAIYFTERIEYWKNITGIDYSLLKIGRGTRLLGHCDMKNNITISWKAITFPEEIIDYLILHELSHVKYKDHSKKFWNLVESYIPDWKRRRRWLKEKSFNLISNL